MNIRSGIADDNSTLIEDVERPVRRGALRRLALVSTVVIALALVGVWTQRKPLAQNYIGAELEKRGVPADYKITKIGFRTQRIENLRIGDPKNPDLTADWAEVITSFGITGVKVSEIRTGGVRLRGKLVGGSFSFGTVDKLLPPPSGKPFTLPDIDLDVVDGRLALELPNGPIAAVLNGKGNLTDGFAGKITASAPKLAIGTCAANATSAQLNLKITDRQPKIDGPVQAAIFTCGVTKLDTPRLVVDARLNEALNHWQGSTRIAAGSLSMPGRSLTGINGNIDFDGRIASTRGNIRLDAQTLFTNGVSGKTVSLDGGYMVGQQAGRPEITFQGRAAIASAALDPKMLTKLENSGKTGQGTPIGPLIAAVTSATKRAAQNMTLAAEFGFGQSGKVTSLRVASLTATSNSGAKLRLAGDKGDSLFLADKGASKLNAVLSVSGGGLPNAAITIRQNGAGAPISGAVAMAPYVTGGARLAITPFNFSASPSGQARFETRVTLDGPLGDGHVSGLSIPISGRFDGRGGVSINPVCTPLSFISLQSSALALGRNQITLCPFAGNALFARNGAGQISGGAKISAVNLSGEMGGRPISMKAGEAHMALGTGQFALDQLMIRLGTGDDITRLEIPALHGAVWKQGMAGKFTGLSGKIINVPINVTQGDGSWTMQDGTLNISASLHVADALQNPQPRYNPLISNDFKLHMAGGVITASGVLREEKNKIPVADVDITHILSKMTGHATLHVNDLRFGPQLQPDALTPLALGVVANVDGAVNGRGDIRWTSKGVTSDGIFRTDAMNLAAAFGPVNALSGEIHFSDLLGLVTKPGQVLTLGEVNPGIAVLNGTITYQLLPDRQMHVEGGRWPFAGGDLILEPTVLDLTQEKERRLTFKVIGLDAGQFINQFGFKDIDATGTFDGVIPMIFDRDGGRITGGRLVVRRGGGRLAYVGEISNAEMGMFSKLAFDALKSLHYDRLSIELDGAIDGEMVTGVKFAGVNQDNLDIAPTGFFKQFMGLPFIFNITIKAPFRGLMNTARSFYDPSLLIRQNLPGFESAEPIAPATSNPVQPKESEKMR